VHLTSLTLIVPLVAACRLVHEAAGEKRYHVPSPAMRPTFRQDTTVTAKTLKAGDYRAADGDVVVLRPPAGWGRLTSPRETRLRPRWTGPEHRRHDVKPARRAAHRSRADGRDRPRLGTPQYTADLVEFLGSP
jgi:hypothetical protein